MKFIMVENRAFPIERVRELRVSDNGVQVFIEGEDTSFRMRTTFEAASQFVDALARDCVPAIIGYSVAFCYPPVKPDTEFLHEIETVLAFLVSRERYNVPIPITARGSVDLWDEDVVLIEPHGTARNENDVFDSLDAFLRSRIKAFESIGGES